MHGTMGKDGLMMEKYCMFIIPTIIYILVSFYKFLKYKCVLLFRNYIMKMMFICNEYCIL